jgi:hypothetical protein
MCWKFQWKNEKQSIKFTVEMKFEINIQRKKKRVSPTPDEITGILCSWSEHLLPFPNVSICWLL